MAAAIVAAGLALLAGACNRGNESATGSGGSTKSGSAVAYSACMRSHDVLNFPDPDSRGAIPKVGPQQLGVSSSRFQQAQSACAHLLQPAAVQIRQTLSGMLDFARCMRSHGAHDWPDPTTESDGQPVFDLRGQINPNSTQISTTSDVCAPLLHPAPGQNGTVLCNGIGEDGCHHYG